MSKRKREREVNKSRKKKAPKRHPDQDIFNLLFLKEAIDKSHEKVPKNMTENDLIRWIRDTIKKTTPPRQVGVRKNFAPGAEAQAIAYVRRLQDLTPTPTPISLIKPSPSPSPSNFKRKLLGGDKKRKTRRFKKKRRKRRKRRRKSTRKRR